MLALNLIIVLYCIWDLYLERCCMSNNRVEHTTGVCESLAMINSSWVRILFLLSLIFSLPFVLSLVQLSFIFFPFFAYSTKGWHFKDISQEFCFFESISFITELPGVQHIVLYIVDVHYMLLGWMNLLLFFYNINSKVIFKFLLFQERWLLWWWDLIMLVKRQQQRESKEVSWNVSY